MQDAILKLLGREGALPLTPAEVAAQLRLPANRQRELERTLETLERTGRVARIKGNRYIQPREADLIPGRIRMNRQGRGFLQPDDPGLKEVMVPENATSTAMHEDRVLVRLDASPQGLLRKASGENTGAVIRVLERRRTRLVGTLQRSRQFYYVIPDDPRIPHDFYVPPPRAGGRACGVGDKVVVELREWQSRHTNPEGVVVEVLGPSERQGVDMLSILRQYGLEPEFPGPVVRETRGLPARVLAEQWRGRVDCRSHGVVTIDPDDAKDFDDAFFLERGGGDGWRLWVHVADVSHYVKSGTALDAEARRRGNSTYLVDRVIPMLPEALSNELCSLKPGVERLTRCVEFLIAEDGRVRQTRFHTAVIRSQRRFTYGEALAIIQRAPVDATEQMLHDAHALAQRIRQERFRHGSLALDFPERKIRLDAQGRVAAIEKVENDVSHQLIEEFMLLANEAVARRLNQAGRPALHRVHEEPDARRLREYREEVLSHGVPCGDLRQRGEVRKLLERLDELPIGAALKIGFLRSLMRARYAVESLGHYGLAKRQYAHFTSPIRRYADLVVHRALFQEDAVVSADLRETAEHLSVTERNSADAERDSKDAKLFAHLQAQLGDGQPQTYTALVVDVRNFGFFVDVPELTLGGLVHLSSLDDDFYTFDAVSNQVIGRRTRRQIRLGDELPVQVAKIDPFKKQVDFRWVNPAPGARRPAARPGRPAAGATAGRGRARQGGTGRQGGVRQGGGSSRGGGRPGRGKRRQGSR